MSNINFFHYFLCRFYNYLLKFVFLSPQSTQNQLPRQIEPVVIVHGGAGDIPDSRDNGKHDGTKLAARLGYDKLMAGGSVLDAVEEAVRSMELDENFNAGYLLLKLKRHEQFGVVEIDNYASFSNVSIW